MKVYKQPTEGGIVGIDNVKPGFVLDDLNSLHGPTQGTVTLPIRLDWSASPLYDLGKANRVRTLYTTVLREACSEEDLTTFLSQDLLIAVWASLRIPELLRHAWEIRHPELRQC